jgi:hypothetical protein
LVEAIDDFHPSLKNTGWFEFLMMFHDQNLQVAKAFALNFDGQSANIGDIVLQVNEAMISRAKASNKRRTVV